MSKKIITLFFALLCGRYLYAQPEIVNRGKYNFVDFNKNKLFIPDSIALSKLYGKLQRLLLSGDEQINIVHIGDSHIQSDVFSNRLRQRFQTYFPGGNGGRGFVFPYKMAHTNNPDNYAVTFTGTWTSCRNIQRGADCLLGLAGISVTTHDANAKINIHSRLNTANHYDYTHVKVFFYDPDNAYTISLDNEKNIPIAIDGVKRKVAEWDLEQPASELHIHINRRAGMQGAFTLFGISLGTDDPGIIYHSIGVNSATVAAFLKCDLLPAQINELNPDLVILSLGTNDAYGKTFDEDAFIRRLQLLITRIKEKNPETGILLTTPSDCYHGKACNLLNLKARDAIFKVARENHVAVWDFFTVMGGLKSMIKWQSKGLATRDKVHLTIPGYELQGDLLYEAFIEAFDSYSERDIY